MVYKRRQQTVMELAASVSSAILELARGASWWMALVLRVQKLCPFAATRALLAGAARARGLEEQGLGEVLVDLLIRAPLEVVSLNEGLDPLLDELRRRDES